MAALPLIFAFGFGAGGVLIWLAAAGTPWLIHWWTRRKYREAPWAAMEYLLAAIHKHARRARIEQWLLLAIRTAIVVLVVAAMAQPYWDDSGLGARRGEPAYKVLVIDGSYSMAYKPADQSRFDWAKQRALELVEQSPSGDGFSVVLMGDAPRVVVAAPWFERRAIQEEIQNLKLPHGGGNVDAALSKIDELFAQARREQPRLARQEVYFFTDLGRTSWDIDSLGTQAAQDIRKRIGRWKEAGVAAVVLDVGQPTWQNAAVTDIRSLDAFVAPQRPVEIAVRVRNFGTQPLTQQPVTLWIDGTRVKETAIDVPAQSEADVNPPFQWRFESPGTHFVEARLANDALDIDNHRWLSLRVLPAARVLCVDGSPGGRDFGGAADYLRVALDPDGDQSGPLPVRAQVVNESALTETDLHNYDCVCLANVGQFTPGEATSLDRYLDQGGSLIFFLGDRVSAERYNRELVGESGRRRILPVRLDQPAAAGRFHFNPLGYQHPIVKVFEHREDAGLLTTPIYRYFRVKPVANSTSHVVLAFDSGDPAIIEETIGRGRVIVSALPASIILDPDSKNAWTWWPKWPSFPPLVQEMLAFALQRRGDDMNTVVGRSLSDPMAPAGESSVTITMPDGRREVVRCQPNGQWSLADTWLSGAYTAQYASQPDAARTFAVNVNTAESDLTKVNPRDLPDGIRVRSTWQDPDQPVASAVLPREAAEEWFLYPLLGLLLVETFLAWLLGTRAA